MKAVFKKILVSLFATAAMVSQALCQTGLEGLAEKERAVFDDLRAKYRNGELSIEGNVEKGRISPIDPSLVKGLPERGTPEYERLFSIGAKALAEGEVGVVVLAGGMATRFGGVAKAVVPVVDDKSFIKLKIEDARKASARFGSSIPVYVMTSFATEKAISEHVKNEENIHLFRQQRMLPRLNEDGTLFRKADGSPSYYATGHGEFRDAFVNSGALEEFRGHGGKYLIFSNVDNVVATVDPVIVGLHIEQGRELTVEVAPKVPGDKGGAPATVDGRPQIVEGFRFPSSFNQDSIKVFSTNTMVFNAEALERSCQLPWYTVHKKVDGKTVVQFEQIVGDMTRLLDTDFVQVSRDGVDTRFEPIKKPDELGKRSETIRKALEHRWSQAEPLVTVVETKTIDPFEELNRAGSAGCEASSSSKQLARAVSSAYIEGLITAEQFLKIVSDIESEGTKADTGLVKTLVERYGLSKKVYERLATGIEGRTREPVRVRRLRTEYTRFAR